MKKPGWYKTSDMARFFVGEHVEGIEFRAPDDDPSTNAQQTPAQNP
jgi:hypothetical protein